MVKLKYNQKEMSIDIAFLDNENRENLVYLVKLMPDREFKNIDGRKFWRVPIQAGVNLGLLIGEFIEDCKKIDPEVQCEDEKIFYAIQLVEHWKADNLILSSRMDFDGSQVFNSMFKGILTGAQRAAAEYMFRNARGVICGNSDNDRRLSTIAVLEAGEDWPALIICSQAKKFIWSSRIKLLTGKNVLILGEEQETLARVRGDLDNGKAAPVVVVNFGILAKNEAWLSVIPWKALVIDESHYIKNSKSGQASILIDLAKEIPHRFLLSDTDYVLDPALLSVQLEIIDRMKSVFGSRTAYLTRYRGLNEGTNGWRLGLVDHVGELDRLLRSNCYVKSEMPSEEKQMSL